MVKNTHFSVVKIFKIQKLCHSFDFNQNNMKKNLKIEYYIKKIIYRRNNCFNDSNFKESAFLRSNNTEMLAS